MIAAGMENMSMSPFYLPKARYGYRMGGLNDAKADLIDGMVFDGLYEGFYGYHMGMTAENIAAKYGITREEQDKLGLMSHQRALAAIKDGTFKKEMTHIQ